MRILVTGSRNWPRNRFEFVDDQICDVFGYKKWQELHQQITIVHGACPRGADLAAHITYERLRTMTSESGVDVFREDPHPAKWSLYGKPAGFIRNTEMIKLGADICLAFPLGESRGTRHTIALAQKARIPTMIFEG